MPPRSEPKTLFGARVTLDAALDKLSHTVRARGGVASATPGPNVTYPPGQSDSTPARVVAAPDVAPIPPPRLANIRPTPTARPVPTSVPARTAQVLDAPVANVRSRRPRWQLLAAAGMVIGVAAWLVAVLLLT
jgi:hypothetical protein